MKETELESIYKQREWKINQALDFIEKHKEIQGKVNPIENSKSLVHNNSTSEKIRILFIECLNAAGGSNLTLNGPTAKNFHFKLKKLSPDGPIKLHEFYRCFDPSISNFTELYEYLHKSREFKNFGKKKSALFIYKLDWLQNNLESNHKIFENYSIEKTELIIPIDAVIILILNKLLGTKKENFLSQYKDFDLINIFFKSKLGRRFILIEDLWFWGFFNTKGSGKNRKIEFNEDKFYTAVFIEPSESNKKRILEFLDIINNETASR